MSKKVLNHIGYPLSSWKLLLAFSPTNAESQEKIHAKLDDKFDKQSFVAMTDWIRYEIQKNVRERKAWFHHNKEDVVKDLLLDLHVLHVHINKIMQKYGNIEDQAVCNLFYLEERDVYEDFSKNPTFISYARWFKSVAFEEVRKQVRALDYYGSIQFFHFNPTLFSDYDTNS